MSQPLPPAAAAAARAAAVGALRWPFLQGEIYWVNIPPRDTRGSEQHGHPNQPCVIMSRDLVNRRLNTVVVVPLTTHQHQVQLADQPPFRIVIHIQEIAKDVLCTLQIALCVAKTDQVRVIDKSRLQERIGKMSRSSTI